MKCFLTSRWKPILSMRIAAVASVISVLTLPALAVDHDNIDANRPLDFDDAETIAYKEKSLEFGASLNKPKNGKSGVAGEAEFLYGFKKNWHLNLSVDPTFLSDDGDQRRFSAGDISIGVQHNFNRETEVLPAFGFRADAILPTGRGSSGTDFRLRGIASRKLGEYGRLHLNADLNINNSPENGERKTRPCVILGYSQPLGYPTRFDRTLVAQLGYRTSTLRENSGIVNVGIGIRQQVTPRSIFDLGVLSDISGGGSDRETIRLVVGHSTAF